MASNRYGDGALDTKPLAQPLHFEASGRTAKNRFLKGPMTENLATWSTKNVKERGCPTDEMVEVYRRWGEGENSWGVIITGNIDISFDALTASGDAIITRGCPTSGERFEKFKELAAAAKANGSLILGQITHVGRQLWDLIDQSVVSASDVQLEPMHGLSFAKPHAATKEEIAELVEGFVYAAEYLEKAGFDGVELHGAHGFLISQFLSRTTNRRTDEYGTQTMENRLRFISDIARGIRARVSPGFIVAAKLNSVEFKDGGVTPEEAYQVCHGLESLGMDFVELSGGTLEKNLLFEPQESTRKREAFFLEWTETIIKAMGPNRKMKVYATGSVRSVAGMLQALEITDGVTMGRPAAAEPHLPARILEDGVSGAIHPVEELANDFNMGMKVAQTQMTLIGRGKQPIDASDASIWAQYKQDAGAWFQKMVEAEDKFDFLKPVEFTGPQLACSLFVKPEFPFILRSAAMLGGASGGAAVAAKDDHGGRNLDRRKACDVCVKKKIKCDMANPACSNCVLYHTECKMSFIKRKPRGARQGLVRQARAQQANAMEKVEFLSSQRPSWTQQQSEAGHTIDTATVGTLALRDDSTSADGNTAQDSPEEHYLESPESDHKFYSSQKREPRQLSLPPFEEVLPVVEHYFNHVNCFVPLFHQSSFMRLLNSWYNQPATQSRAKWASIHIVMAMGLSMADPFERKRNASNAERANDHLRKAASTRAEMTVHDEDLLGIQVLLGVIILSQDSTDQKPASIIMAAAMRLAQRLMLSSSRCVQLLDPEEALQSSRVFWLAYTLDREVSIHMKIPYLQAEADIDVALPPVISSDGAGLVWSSDGRHSANYFRLRVELAHVQGRVYDTLFANRAALLTAAEHQTKAALIKNKLDQWYQQIPLAFRIEHILSTATPEGLVQMTKMYHLYILCETMVHGFFNHNAEWMRRASTLDRFHSDTLTNQQDRFKPLCLSIILEEPSPDEWAKLIDLSRGCLKLFHAATKVERIERHCSCGQAAAFLVLATNLLLDPSKSSSLLDSQLCSTSVAQFDKFLAVGDDKILAAMNDFFKDLLRKVEGAMESHKRRQDENLLADLSGYGAEWEILLPSAVDLESASFLDASSTQIRAFDEDPGGPFEQCYMNTF